MFRKTFKQDKIGMIHAAILFSGQMSRAVISVGLHASQKRGLLSPACSVIFTPP